MWIVPIDSCFSQSFVIPSGLLLANQYCADSSIRAYSAQGFAANSSILRTTRSYQQLMRQPNVGLPAPRPWESDQTWCFVYSRDAATQSCGSAAPRSGVGRRVDGQRVSVYPSSTGQLDGFFAFALTPSRITSTPSKTPAGDMTLARSRKRRMERAK